MKRRWIPMMAVLAAAVCGLARADEGAAAKEKGKTEGTAPKPGPEIKRLAPFVGTWKTESEVMKNDMFPSGKGTGMQTCEWFRGGYFLVCNNSGKGPMGPERGMGILGYDPAEKVYTYYGFDNMGMGMYARGTVEGDTWTWTNEMKMGDKTIKSRFTMKEDSATVHTMKWEMSPDGQTWSTAMQGKETKVAKAAKAAGEKKPEAAGKK